MGTWPNAGQPTADGVVVLVVASGDKGSPSDSGNKNND